MLMSRFASLFAAHSAWPKTLSPIPQRITISNLLLTLCKEMTPGEQKQLMSLLLRRDHRVTQRLGIRDR
jgi:hypothetical protein